MVIGIDASQANREKRSGTEWYAFYLIKEFARLLKDRDDITLRLYFRNKPREDLTDGLPKNFQIKHLRWPLKYIWAQGRLSLEMLFHPPDVLFSPAHTIPLFHPQNIFTTLHDVGFAEFPELYDRVSLWYHRFSAKLAVKRAKHIFTISEYTRRKIIELYNCPEGKLSVVYLGYDKDKFKPLSREETEPVLDKYNLEYKDYLLYLGRIEPKKNIQNIIRAYELLDDAPDLILAGRIITHPETDNPKVRFLGYIEEQDKPALLAGASVFVFPTLYEGFGLPIVEAQACGTPVITSNTTSNPEIAGEGALIVDPRKPEEIAEAIRRLISPPLAGGDKGEGEQLIQKGFENIKRFDWHKTAKQTLEIVLTTQRKSSLRRFP